MLNAVCKGKEGSKVGRNSTEVRSSVKGEILTCGGIDDRPLQADAREKHARAPWSFPSGTRPTKAFVPKEEIEYKASFCWRHGGKGRWGNMIKDMCEAFIYFNIVVQTAAVIVIVLLIISSNCIML